jgi:hypothetical protein
MGSFCFFSYCLLSSPWLPFVVAACPGALVVNEVYYDHPGTDGGYEFVEFFNASSEAVVLDGVSLDFHNGAGVGWTTLWHGTTSDTIAAGGLFTVGDELVRPVPDVVLGLSLQNGPDAVALFCDGEPLDVVGYGGLDDPGYVESTGVDRVSAGRSIARIPDGRDTGDNHADFAAAIPTPARFNLARHDAYPRPASGTRVRDVLEHGVADLRLTLVNGGTQEIAARAVTVVVMDSTDSVVSALGEWTNGTSIEVGRSADLTVPLALSNGYHWITATTIYPPDERANNDSLVLLRRVGSPPLLVSEVLSSPRPGCPQFVEVYHAGGAVVTIAGYGLRDRVHDPVVVAGEGARVAPGDFVVFTPDVVTLLEYFDAPAASVYPVDATWPTINRTGQVADSVVFVDHLGLEVDAVPVPGIPTSAAGRSLERVDLYRGGTGPTWVLSDDPSGASPGRAGRRVLYAPPPPGSIEVGPNPFFPAEGVLTVSIDAPPGARAVVTVFDSRGRRVAAVGVATAFPAVMVWDGSDESGAEALPGLYVLACEVSAGGGTRVEKVVVGCGRR